MDTLLIKAKRKKRKTRKCLDELRKKSRSCFTNFASVQSNLEKGQESCMSFMKPIASNLLQCNKFTKAVHSETIIRSMYPKKKRANIIKYVNTKSVIKNTTDDILGPIPACRNNHDKNPISQEINNSLTNTDENSSDSLILSHSPNEEAIIMPVTNSPSQSVENFGYHLYEELMDSIPKYIKINFMNLIKDDNLVEETREALQNLSINYAHHKLKNKMYLIDKTSASDIKETVVQNPMDYIRFGSMLQGNLNKCKEQISSEDTSPMSNYEYSPENFQSILSNTPEYNYFPHKLN